MENTGERLQKVMAQCGIASRRKCEDLISTGHVKVNGVTVRELGFKVMPKDIIEVDGKQIEKEQKVYFVLYKPVGCVTTVSDEHGRSTVMDLILQSDLKNTRLFPIGRLDYDTSGVLLLTNDGELSNRLLKSDNNVKKSYLARIDGIMNIKSMEKLMKGVVIDGVKTKRATVEIVSTDKNHNSSLVRLVISEGRNRQVRKMFEAVGYTVKHLKREMFAGITLEGLVEGSYRPLSIKEVKVLYSIK